MSTKRICDRCGNDFAVSDVVKVFRIPLLGEFSIGYGNVDLCRSCADELHRFLAGGKVVK